MFATAGTPIIENMMLAEAAAAGAYELIISMAPMKLAAATGLPTRPLAFRRRLLSDPGWETPV
jgi:hypothetical protein